MRDKRLREYVKEYMEGNLDAFDFLYKETEKSVYLSAYSILRDKDESKDIMQDTYIKAINSLSMFDPKTNFKAWISRIARNLAIDRYRALKKTVNMDDSHIEVESEYREDGKSLIDKAYSIIGDDERKRQVFTYRALLNLGFREIGEIMDIPKSTVSDIYRSTVKSIREGIKDEI